MEIIDSVSQLWPVLLILFLALVVIMCRKEIKSVMMRFSKIQVRRGGVEFTLEQDMKAKVGGGIASEESMSKEPDTEPRVEEGGVGLKLEKPIATAEEWESKMIVAFGEKDIEGVKKAFEKAQECEQDEIKKSKGRAFYLYLMFFSGDKNALGELQSMSSQEDVGTEVKRVAKLYIGHCYSRVENFEFALKAYEDAVDMSKTESERASDINQIVGCVYKLGRKGEALRIIMNEIGKTKESDALSTLYVGLARVYEWEKDYELRAFALEKALEIKPNDEDLLFSAGYSYGQKDFWERLAILHYKNLLTFNPEHKMALNNIGVEYGNMDMPMNQIKYYKKSAEKNETLAMANLAYQYLKSGFKEEASEIIEEARKQENVHKNVGKAYSAISEKVEEEENKEEQVVGEARERQSFVLKFAEAYFAIKSGCPKFDGVWSFPEGIEMEISQEDNVIEGYWSSKDEKLKLDGEISNRGAKVTFYIWKYLWGKDKSDYEKDTGGYVYITEDGQKLNIMKISGDKHSIKELNRKS